MGFVGRNNPQFIANFTYIFQSLSYYSKAYSTLTNDDARQLARSCSGVNGQG